MVSWMFVTQIFYNGWEFDGRVEVIVVQSRYWESSCVYYFIDLSGD